MKLLDHFPPRSATWGEALDNSHCSLTVDLLIWRFRFNCGLDHNASCCELIWLYIDFGPIGLKLAIGH